MLNFRLLDFETTLGWFIWGSYNASVLAVTLDHSLINGHLLVQIVKTIAVSAHLLQQGRNFI
jgi:hypothetical protein